METSPLLAAPAQIEAAVNALRHGECVGMPTETVYGLAADALNPQAVARIFALKGRPSDHPVIVHLPEAARMVDFARDIPGAAWALAERFWPGPLTLILRRADKVPAQVSGGQDTIGLRVPSHPLALQLLRAFGGGLAAPSANRFGRISPTCAQHVRDEFGAALPIVLDGGPCAVGIESTIVDLSTATPRILRPGMIAPAAIIDAIGPLAEGSPGPAAPRVSGTLEKHYAPRAPLHLFRPEQVDQIPPGSAVLALRQLPPGCHGRVLGEAPAAYAQQLYAALRALDNSEQRPLWLELPPASGEWSAIHDRLRRAAAGAGQAH